jgi:RHS repeat-associated protein
LSSITSPLPSGERDRVRGHNSPLTKGDRGLSSGEGQTSTFAFTYDSSGRRTKLTYPNGVTTTYSYDSIGRLTNLQTQYTELQNHGKHRPPKLKLHTLDSFTYTHDKVDNRLSKTEISSPSPLEGEGGVRGKKYDYSYDAIYRLLQSLPTKLDGKDKEQENKAETFTYDLVGNRLTGPKDKLNYNYNVANQLTELIKEKKEDEEKKTEYTYDKNGNLIKKVEFDDDGQIKKTTLYTYDYENRLIKVEIQRGDKLKVVTFTYDPFGRRLSKAVHREEIDDNNDGDDDRDAEDKVIPRTTYYVYDNENIIMEYNHKGKPIGRYIHGAGIDEPLAIERKAKTYYYHLDGLGSVTALTDSKGKVVQRYDYDSFGNLKHHGHNKVKQPYTYTAREYDRETGLYYYRKRYYDAKIGRIISKDPFAGFIDLPQTLNPYPYVRNNPIKLIDPFGLSSLTYDSGTGTLTLYDGSGNQLGQFPAGNNTTSNSTGPWPSGTYPYSYYMSHPESGPNGPYGSHGNFVFEVPGRAGMGVHSGREGPQSSTQGCIRTTDQGTETISNLNATDPLTVIIVR